MLDSRLRDFTRKKELLYSPKVTDEARNGFADQLLDAERFGEALEFLEITKDRTRLDRVLEEGIRRGDTFLILRAEKLRGEPATPDHWREAADQALAAGRFFDAYRALTKAGEEERAEAIRAEHIPDYRPFKPEGK